MEGCLGKRRSNSQTGQVMYILYKKEDNWKKPKQTHISVQSTYVCLYVFISVAFLLL
jgi:hypothetical protein